MKLDVSSWWDENDPECLIYIHLRDEEGNSVWVSDYYEFGMIEFEEDMDRFRREIAEELEKRELKADLSSNNYNDWKILE